MPGLYLEDLVAGTVPRHSPTRSVANTDTVPFSRPTFDPRPLPVDLDFAAKSERGRRPVGSVFTLGPPIGKTDVTFPAPVLHGDTIRVETEGISARPSRSRGDADIAACHRRAADDDGTRVAERRRQGFMKRRPNGTLPA